MQSTVNFNQATGIVGDIVINGPQRGKPAILLSTVEAENVIGRAAYHIPGSDLNVTIDAVTEGEIFAGLLANSKVYASAGTTSGALEPTLTLPNNTNVELVTMTSGILVHLENLAADDPRIGWVVGSVLLTGKLKAFATATLLAADALMVDKPIGVIVRENLEGEAAGVDGIMEMTL